MNAQHKICRIGNRLRRIWRRIDELNDNKRHEIMRAEENKREPVLGDILSHVHRLRDRARELSHK